jgi:hypothetical protein
MVSSLARPQIDAPPPRPDAPDLFDAFLDAVRGRQRQPFPW